jgi:disulfide bond formation protein DsbB
MCWPERAADALVACLLRPAGAGGDWPDAGRLGIGEWMKLQPCPLCIFQRLLYLLIALLALAGVLLPAGPPVGRAARLTAAGGLATAAYQSWLQYLPEASMECGFGEPTVIEQIVDWFGVRWPAMFMATGFCSSKDWVFLGLSMANWSGSVFSPFWRCGGNWLATFFWPAARRSAVSLRARRSRPQAWPVLPKPPSPRALAAKSSTTLKRICKTGTTTSCARRSSGCSVKVAGRGSRSTP